MLTKVVSGTAELWGYIVPVLIVVSITLAGRIVEGLLRRRLVARGRKTGWRGYDAIVRAGRHKITVSSLLLGLAVAMNSLPWALTHSQLDLMRKALLVAFLIVLVFVAADTVDSVLTLAPRSEAHPAVSIVDTLIRTAIYVIGAIIILQQVFGYDLGPALAALGVAGLAVSLALQSTLTDLISGIQIIVARQVRIGDYVQLSTGEEGYATDIGWRTTTIRQLSNNLVIIPNSAMTSTILVNYHTPETAMSVPVNLGVAYDSDLDKVERVTVEVAKEVMATVPGGVPEHEPFIRYNEFGPSSIRFTVIMRCKEFTDQYLIKHEFIRRLAQRYRVEGIQIPFPMTTVRIQQVEASEHALAPVGAGVLPMDAG
jgi:small-conductance mechanosensitive channel